MKDIAIYGAGGFGREVASLIKRINRIENQWNFVGFFDDDFRNKPKGSSNEYGSLLGGIDDLNTLAQPIVNLMSNLAYRVGRTGFRQYKKLLKGANERNTDSIIKEYTTGNKRRDKSELEIFKTNSSNDYDIIRNKLFSNFN